MAPMNKARISMTRPTVTRGAVRLIAALLVTSCGLVACSTLKTGLQSDDAPANPRDVSNVPDAVPRAEPPSRYGNPKSYKVYGETYYPLAMSKNYTARGTASWYGTKFHGKRTSSGEPYDMYAMTAAHKTLPLPTYVEITNLKNGRTVIVKVNDRGPFHGDRLIDLSYSAAAKLDILQYGTGQVEIRAIDTQQVATAAPPAASVAVPDAMQASEALYLQVGAFSSRGNAQRMQADLQSQNIGAVRIVETSTAAGTFFKVQVGPLASHTEVNRVTQDLKTLGINNSHSIVR